MDTRLIAKKKQLESWAAIIHECKNSGIKTKDWLAENNISRDQYYYWLRLVREQAYFQGNPSETINQVVKIECDEPIVNTSSTSPDMITVKYGRLQMDIPVNANPDTIKALMEVAIRAK